MSRQDGGSRGPIASGAGGFPPSDRCSRILLQRSSLHRSDNPKDMKMMKRIALFLPAIVVISLPLVAASPKSDGYYGKTKVAPKALVKAHPFDLGGRWNRIPKSMVYRRK